MSVLFDCLWWWRAEFGGKCNPYIEPESDRVFVSSSTGTMEAATIGQQSLHTPAALISTDQSTPPSQFLDASELPDWNWEELGDLDMNWF
jgi:transcriptional regulatory protein LEU3